MSNPYRFTENAYGIWTETAPQLRTRRPRRQRRGGVAVEQSRIEWRPSPPIASSCVSDRTVEFDVTRFLDGNRRLAFVGGYGPFLEFTMVAGLAVQEDRGLSPEEVFSYRFMMMVFNRMRAGQEHRKRKLAAESDLVVRRSGRGGEIDGTLIPDYVGCDADGSGKTWSAYRLKQKGRELAAQLAITKPNECQLIACGFMVAARLNPLTNLRPEEIDSLLFQALFDAGDLPMDVSEETVDDVQDRLLEAIEEHGEDTWTQFSRWWSGAKSNLVKTLAGKAGRAKLPRDTVKAALLKLGWRSYRYVAGCLSIFAQAVRASLVEPLNAEERRLFDAMYLPQAHFGGLPLVLLLERGSLIEPVVTQMWNAPDDESLVGVLHRMLTTYSDVAGARRVADRRFKARRRPDGKQASETNDEELFRNLAAAARAPGRLQQIAGSLLERTGRGCPDCVDATHWEITSRRKRSKNVGLSVCCGRHDFAAEYVVPFAEIVEEAHRMQADDD